MNATADPSTQPVTMEAVRHEIHSVAMAFQGVHQRIAIIKGQCDFLCDAAEHGFISPGQALAKIQQLRKEHGL